MKNPFTSPRSAVASGILIFSFLWVFFNLTVPDSRAESSGPMVISAAEIDYPPFSIVDETGRAYGFSVELMRTALAAMNRSVTFKSGPWHQVRTWLETGEVDALPLVGRTREREALFDFTFPYMSLSGAIVVRKGTTGIQRLNDLKGRQVAVMKGDNAEEFLRREDRGIDIITRPSFDIALQELAAGQYDAVFIQRLVAIRLIQESSISGLEISRHPVEEFRQDFCFAVQEGDKDMLALLNEGLALVMADGTFRRLHAKWFAALQLPVDRPVIIGGDHNYPPFEFINDDGVPDGYMVELTRAIAREMNMDIQIRLKPWADTVLALETGEIDAIQGIFYSVERDQTLDFSPSHMMSHYVGVVADNQAAPPETPAELADLSLVVQQGDIILEFLTNHDLMSRVTMLENLDDVLQAVSEKRFDCALVPRIGALHMIEKKGWTHLRLSRQHFFVGEYSYAVKDGNQALLAQLNEGLNILNQTGEYRRIHDKWLGMFEKEPLPLERIIHYLAMVTIPLMLILLGMFLWSRALRREVARKTRELQDSADRFKYVFDSANVGKSFTYLDGRINANQTFVDFLGYTREELQSKTWQELTPAEDIERIQNILDGVISGKNQAVRFEKQYIHKTGALVWADVSAVIRFDSQGRPLYFVATIVDITQRKKAQQHIQHLNQVLRAIRDINQLIVRERDRDILIREGCRLLVAHRGYPSAMIVLTDENNIPVSWAMDGKMEDSKELNELLTQGQLPQCCIEAEASREIVVNHNPKTGCHDCPVSQSCAGPLTVCVPLSHMNEIFGYLNVSSETVIVQGDEEYLLLNEMGQDFAYALSTLKIESERKKGQKALAESEQRFKTFAELAPVGILISDDQENVLYISPKFTEIFGYTLADVPSARQWWSLAYPDPELRKTVQQRWQTAMETAVRTGEEIDPMEYPVTCKDNTVREIKFLAATTGTLTIVVFTDISEEKKQENARENLQAQLNQAQKMESVGRLAGGVAHDFNNMLNVIIGYAELGQMKATPDDPLHADLEEILDAARRSSDIIRQLLAFARKQTIQPKVMDINELIEGTLKMLRRLIGEDITLFWQPGANLRSIYMDATQMDQILANLLVNAKDAIDGVGTVTIETRKVTLDRQYCEVHAGFTPGDFVLLAVSDDGCGMDRHTREKLFEPFFSTKKKGKGTGLGLATVYGIVKQNNGFINVYSEPGTGTIFKIYLPCHDEQIEKRLPDKEMPLPAAQGETLLIVEDEKAILTLAQKVLENQGYQVIAVSDPLDALARIQDHDTDIHLLLTDVVMPNMNGRDLSKQVQAIYPDVKILFMSGYTANTIAHHGILDTGVNFLQKPFSSRDLAIKIRTILDGNGS
jgi:PAS domain S-box-containing protein